MVKLLHAIVGLNNAASSEPWQFLLLILRAGSTSSNRKSSTTYEPRIRVPRKSSGKKRILLTMSSDDDLPSKEAFRTQAIGRYWDVVRRRHVPPLAPPAVAKKWDYSERRNSVGRPRVRQAIVDHVLQFAKESPSWGYDRIEGALANVGYSISATTVGKILEEHGIERARDRKRQTTWKTFIKSHWDVLAASRLHDD